MQKLRFESLESNFSGSAGVVYAHAYSLTGLPVSKSLMANWLEQASQ